MRFGVSGDDGRGFFSNLVWLGVGHRIEEGGREGEEAAAVASQKGESERELNQRAMAGLPRASS